MNPERRSLWELEAKELEELFKFAQPLDSILHACVDIPLAQGPCGISGDTPVEHARVVRDSESCYGVQMKGDLPGPLHSTLVVAK